MSTFVLVHGGGHGGWCYAKVKQRLEAKGHTVFAPSLSGLAEHQHQLSPSIDLDTHITDVVSLLRHWDLRDVVLVGHSYGGMVVTGVAGPVITSVRPMGETRDGRLWSIDTGHDLMITEPDLVTDALLQIAEDTP